MDEYTLFGDYKSDIEQMLAISDSENSKFLSRIEEFTGMTDEKLAEHQAWIDEHARLWEAAYPRGIHETRDFTLHRQVRHTEVNKGIAIFAVMTALGAQTIFPSTRDSNHIVVAPQVIEQTAYGNQNSIYITKSTDFDNDVDTNSKTNDENVIETTENPSIAWMDQEVLGWNHLVEESASNHGIDPRLTLMMMKLESNGKNGLVSRAGAQGLMQIMDTTTVPTATDLARREGYAYYDINDPATNIEFASIIISENIIKYERLTGQSAYGYDGELTVHAVGYVGASYNGGPVRGSSYLRGESIPPETMSYVNKLQAMWNARYDQEFEISAH